MVTQLGWEPLQVRRVKIRLLLLFKIQYNLVAIPAEAYLLPSDSRTRAEYLPDSVNQEGCLWLICPVLYGSHIDAAYSKVGGTIVS
jgi:hypothetical protein